MRKLIVRTLALIAATLTCSSAFAGEPLLKANATQSETINGVSRPRAIEKELSFRCDRTRHMIRYVQAAYPDNVRHTFGGGRDTSLLYLIADAQPVAGDDRLAVWRLFDSLVNLDDVEIACGRDGSAVYKLRGTPESEWINAVRAGTADHAPLSAYVVHVSKDGIIRIE